MTKKAPQCPLCNTTMKAGKESTSSAGGCVVLVLGVLFLFAFPIGTVLGILMLLGGLSMVSHRRGLWICGSCEHQVERKLRWNELG